MDVHIGDQVHDDIERSEFHCQLVGHVHCPVSYRIPAEHWKVISSQEMKVIVIYEPCTAKTQLLTHFGPVYTHISQRIFAI